MTPVQRLVKWLWTAGMVILPVVAMSLVWQRFHVQSHAQATSAAYHIMVIALAWACWSVGGLLWMQQFNKERMIAN